MSATLAKEFVTVEEYAQLPDGEWQKWELSNGELVPRYGDEMGARTDHNSIRDEVRVDLGNYLRANPIGRAITEQDFQLADGVVRRPDCSVILRENLGLIADSPAIVPGPPDLAIEVVSPSNRAEDVELKINQLLESGCKLVWVIYRRLGRVVICEPQGRRREVGVHAALEAPELLPGFRLELGKLFERSRLAEPAPLRSRL